VSIIFGLALLCGCRPERLDGYAKYLVKAWHGSDFNSCDSSVSVNNYHLDFKESGLVIYSRNSVSRIFQIRSFDAEDDDYYIYYNLRFQTGEYWKVGLVGTDPKTAPLTIFSASDSLFNCSDYSLPFNLQLSSH